MAGAYRSGSSTETEKWLIGPMIEVLSELQAQSDWTWKHSSRVAQYAVIFGKKLGLSAEEMLVLQCAAILHDVGKIVVSSELLDKSSPLERDEWYAITKHPMASYKALKAQSLSAAVARVVQSHHEWYNGKGYPLGLEGDAIPLGARILSLADAYDAMCSDRPYRAALQPAQIVEELSKGAGTQFDPVLVHKLKSLLEQNVLNLLPTYRMRVISDDPLLYQQLWFAAAPHGWEISAWPPEIAKECPRELLTPSPAPGNERFYLTVVDERSIRRVPAEILEQLPENTLWIDPVDGQQPATYRPLDLLTVLEHLRNAVGEEPLLKPSVDAIRIVIADPYQLFRQGLQRCL